MAKDPMNNPTHSDVPSEPLKNSTKSGTSNSAKQSPAAAGTPTFPTSVESQESAPTHPTADTASHTAAKKSAEPPAEPTYPAMEAKQPSGVQGSFAGGTWIALIAGALLLIMLLVFIMQNQDQVDLVLFAWNFRFPAGIGFLLAAISGALIMALVGGVRMFQLRRQIIKTDKHLVETVNSIRATGGEPGKETTR
ncbi:MAG: lipopolysaccharide assembly protein LapA domain-containing protein [Corynebacterium matruchotii]|uniref:LapA family protein n=1 Tax=Corynebacterium matruchotii TaxID=43768 RepID=UPI0036240951